MALKATRFSVSIVSPRSLKLFMYSGALPQRKKVTFAWNKEDVLKVITSMFDDGDIFKYIDLPLSNYTSASYDKVVGTGGKTAGLSMFSGYSYNERSMLSLGVVDADVEIGTELTLVWGRRGRRLDQAHGRAPQAGRDSRRGQPGPLFEGGARDVRRRLANDGRPLVAGGG